MKTRNKHGLKLDPDKFKTTEIIRAAKRLNNVVSTLTVLPTPGGPVRISARLRA
jgi:hypothetical protein